MDNFTKQLIEEFGQGIVDHISRNRGKYAIGAGVAGLAGYGAYNGNLGSAAKNLVNTSAGTLGIATSDLPYEEAPYGQIVDQGLDSTEAIYQAPIDPQVELEPEASFKVGQVAGNVVNSIHQGVDNVRGMFESEELVTPSVDDEEETSGAAIAAGVVGGTGALLAGVANAEKIGRAIKNTGDHIASSVKGKGEDTTRSLAKVLLNTSIKLKESKDKNDSAIKTRNSEAAAKAKAKTDAATKDTKDLKDKLKTHGTNSYTRRKI
jgi:hypothetical protein